MLSASHLACSTFQKSTQPVPGFPSSTIISERSSPSREAPPRLSARPGPLRAVLNNAFHQEGKPGSGNHRPLSPPVGRRCLLFRVAGQHTNRSRASGAECQDKSLSGFSPEGRYLFLTFPLIEPAGRFSTSRRELVEHLRPEVRLCAESSAVRRSRESE
jgi:hypothetical protein